MSNPAKRIIHAVRTKNHSRLRELVTDPEQVSARSEAGRTALHAAAEEGDWEAARLLIKAGAEVNARMHNRETPLHRAAAYGGTCDLLDPDPERRDPFRRSRRRKLHPKTAKAITEIIKARQPALPPDLEPLDTIPAEHKIDAIIAILDCFSSPAELLKELKTRGIDLEQTDPDLAEELCGKPRFLRMVELLLANGADIAAQTENGETVLHGVVEIGRPQMLELLLRYGAIPDQPALEGENPLGLIELALDYDRPELAGILLRHGARFDPEAPGQLHNAASNRRIEVLNWLLDHGAPINQRDDRGDTPLLAGCGHAESLACLLSRGADARVRNDRGQGVLHLCAAWTKCLSLLVPLGLSLDESDAEGKVPLHLAAQSGSAEAVTMLVAAGAAVNARDKAGNTALHLIFVSDESRPDIEFPVFHALVAAGADRSIRNHEGVLPIEAARRWNYPPEYIDLLNPDPATAKPASAFIILAGEPFSVLPSEAMVSFEREGRTWPSSAHLFIAQKTDDPALRETIRQAATVDAARCRLREAGAERPVDWAERCDAVMRAALLAKFQGNAAACDALLATGDAILVSDGDAYWTEGHEPPFNTIGHLLMDVRAELRRKRA